MVRPRKLYAGEKFNRLLVLEDLPPTTRYCRVLCQCDCGTIRDFSTADVVHGESKSCGCYARELSSIRATKHTGCDTGTYRSWTAAKRRCFNPNASDYSRYGGRGITMCDRWKNSFENFRADMGERPSKEHTLDRIDNNGDYTPENCKWSDRLEQQNNKSSCRFETVGCVTLTVTQWERELGFPRRLISGRMSRGMSIAESISKPYKPKKNSKPKTNLCVVQ